MPTADKIDVFQFMALRAPEAGGSARSPLDYVHDTGPLEAHNHERLDANGQVVDHWVVSRRLREPFHPDSPSPVGRLVYNEVFVRGPGRTPKVTNAAVVEGVFGQMT